MKRLNKVSCDCPKGTTRGTPFGGGEVFGVYDERVFYCRRFVVGR
nr:hypothetical protein [uncultured Porphyromonas sp.]